MLSRTCVHGVKRRYCKNGCRGSNNCIHGTFKPLCRVLNCGGGSICVHGKRRTRCSQGCGGGSLCVHGKQKSFCRAPGCGGTSYCAHGKQRSHCSATGCGGGSLCAHGRRRKTCTECVQTNNDKKDPKSNPKESILFCTEQWFWCLSEPSPPWEVDILDPRIGWNFD